MTSGRERIGLVDDAVDVLDRHVGTAGMEVGDRRERDAAAGPARRREPVGGRDEPLRLDGAGIDRGAHAGERGSSEAAQDEIRAG